jgi:threonine dehydrogenase-like Zn-dependent dehydrogenase
MAKDTMKAVVFKGPGKVVIEDRPIPKIKEPTDIIVRVDKVRAVDRCSTLTMLTTHPRQHYVEGKDDIMHCHHVTCAEQPLTEPSQ